MAILIGLIIGIVGYLGVRNADDALDSLYTSNFIPVTALSDMSIRAQSHHADIYRHVIAPDKGVMDSIVRDMREDDAHVAKQLDVFRQSDMSSEEKAAFSNLEKAWRDYLAVVARAIPLSESGQDDKANELINSEGERSFHALESALGHIVDLNKAQAGEAYNAGDKAVARFTMVSLTILVLGVVGLTAIGVAIFKNLLGQLGSEPVDLVRITRQIAQGDLTENIRLVPGDRESVLASMEQMQIQLRQVLGGIRQGASDLSTGANDLLRLSDESSRRAEAQNDSAARIAAAVEELTVSVSHISDNAQAAQQQALDATRMADDGTAIIQQSLAEVQRIESSVSETSEVIATLEKESASISAIVQVIREIADQTNLLALNAAIEAARAGEQGRGFAVVADEVRKLAERTGLSTQEISQLIQRIQEGTHRAAESMGHGLERVREGVNLSTRAGTAIEGIQGSDSLASHQVSDISSTMTEQTSASSDIARSVEVIASMSQENSVATGQVADSSRRMSTLAQSLQQEIGKFRI